MENDEKILWKGQPKQGLLLNTYDVFLIPFSIFIAMQGVFAIYYLLTTGIRLADLLWVVPFFTIGFGILVLRFFYAANRRAKTHYCITDQAVYIARGKEEKRIPLLQFRLATFHEIKGGYGTIFLGHANDHVRQYEGMAHLLGKRRQFWEERPNIPPMLEKIPHVKKVYRILANARKKATFW